MKPEGLQNMPQRKVSMKSSEYARLMLEFIRTKKKLQAVKWLKSQFGFGLRDGKNLVDHTWHYWETERELWFPHFLTFVDEMDEDEKKNFIAKENLTAQREIQAAYDKLFQLLENPVSKFMAVKLAQTINNHTGLNIKT